MIDFTRCLIWGEGHRASQLHDSTGYFPSMQSDRAGGAYKMRSDTRHLIEGRGDPWKARLTTWLINQRERGVEVPMITGEIVDLIDRQRPLPVYERAERLLRFIAKQVARSGKGTVGTRVKVEASSPIVPAAYAWSESIEWDEIAYFMRYLESKGWYDRLEDPTPLREAIRFTGSVTVEGHSRIEEQETNVDSSQAFVATWFDDSMDEVYKKGIAPAIEAAGYEPYWIKEDRRNDERIDDKIIAEIKRSRFLVADLTHGKCGGVRGSVYYEAGFAQGFSIPVIFTCREDLEDKLAFDTRQYPHILWSETGELCEALKDTIEARVGRGPGKGQSN